MISTKEITLIMRFVVIGLIYIILFRLIRIMLMDMKLTIIGDAPIEFALEIVDAPESAGVNVGTIIPIREQASIGRKKNNDLVIEDKFVSNNHALVSIKEGKLFVRDLRSTNGIKINNNKIRGTVPVENDDIIEIGRIIFRIIG